MQNKPEQNRTDPTEKEILAQLKSEVDSVALHRAALYRRQLEKTIEVLEQTRQSFRSKQLKKLREEIESVLETI